jgi:uncharacterized membrane protein
MVVVLWVLLAFGVGYMGDSRRIGFGWALICAIVFSPLIGFAIVLASPRKGSYEEELARLQGKKDDATAVVQQAQAGANLAEQISQLKALYDSGAISEDEYNKAKSKLIG